MLHCNLEDVTSLQIRRKVEEELKMDLKEYRGFLDQQMLVILGQLEKPSRIHEYLYLVYTMIIKPQLCIIRDQNGMQLILLN